MNEPTSPAIATTFCDKCEQDKPADDVTACEYTGATMCGDCSSGQEYDFGGLL